MLAAINSSIQRALLIGINSTAAESTDSGFCRCAVDAGEEDILYAAVDGSYWPLFI